MISPGRGVGGGGMSGEAQVRGSQAPGRPLPPQMELAELGSGIPPPVPEGTMMEIIIILTISYL